jgi:hypothetical protein
MLVIACSLITSENHLTRFESRLFMMAKRGAGAARSPIARLLKNLAANLSRPFANSRAAIDERGDVHENVLAAIALIEPPRQALSVSKT